MPIDASPTTADAPHFAIAGVLIEALAAHDFVRMTRALEADATLSALLPSGHREWSGASAIGGAFEMWFGDAEEFELVDASVGQLGSLLQLRWRLHVRAARRGAGPMIVEQHAYAATGPSGRINRMSLLCSGFWPEPGA
jgi:hypothetical protein